MDKEKFHINLSFLHYGSKDTEIVEFHKDDSFLDIVMNNRVIRHRLIAIAIAVFIIAVIL